MWKSDTDSDIVKMEEQATLSKKMTEIILPCELLLKAGQINTEADMA